MIVASKGRQWQRRGWPKEEGRTKSSREPRICSDLLK
jgi:hypothetical protein